VAQTSEDGRKISIEEVLDLPFTPTGNTPLEGGVLR
jgi:hypothetical protein